MVDSVNMIENGTAPRLSQDGMPGASYDPLLKKENVRLDLSKPARAVHNFIRGCDRVPGAWIVVEGQQVSLFGSTCKGAVDTTSLRVLTEFKAEGCDATHLVCPDGVYLCCGDGLYTFVDKVEVDKKSIPAAKFLQPE
jgi:formyltetrahydrofolate dehydrogenase